MRALVCTRFGGPELLEVRDLPSPKPQPAEIVVAVTAAGVNFPDLLIIQNKYQFKPQLPFIPGSELAGIVTAVGRAVTRFVPGDRVMAFTTHGAFAEEAALDHARALPVPESMDLVTASALLLTYGTMEHALRDRGQLQPGETVLVLGAAGGIGLAAIDIAKALGARVIACASGDEKLDACRAHGADAVINYERDDLREQIRLLTQGRGVDVVCDPVGGRFTEPALRSLAWRGRLLVLGFAAGDIPRIPLNLTLLKGAAIIGVFWGDFVRREPALFAQSVAQVVEWHADGRIKPTISATFPLDRAAEALALMAARQVIGKAVVTMDREI